MHKWVIFLFLALQSWLIHLHGMVVYVPCLAMGVGILSIVGLPEKLSPRFRNVLIGIMLVVFGFAIYLDPPTEAKTWIVPTWITSGIQQACLSLFCIFILAKNLLSFRFLCSAATTLFFSFAQVPKDEDRGTFYLASIASVMLWGLLYSERSASTNFLEVRSNELGELSSNRVRLDNLVFQAALLLCSFVWLLMGTWYLSNLMSSGSFRVQEFLSDQNITRQTDQGSGGLYVASGTLSSVTASQQESPSRIAVRIYGDEPPGYLRGRVFSYFTGTSWSHGPTSRNLMTLRPTIDLPESLKNPQRNSFELNKSSEGPWKSFEIRNDPDRGRVAFSPLGSAVVQANGNELIVDGNQVIRRGLDLKSTYFAWVPKVQAPTPITGAEQTETTQLPSSIDPRLVELSREILDRQEASLDREKIQIIEDYFRDNFEYLIDDISSNAVKDPIGRFVFDQKKGHCELFATAAALILRANQIPARYVVGYTAMELEPDEEDFWVARNENAHAWVEAYDRQLRRWVIVEATPGIDIPKTVWPEQDGSTNLTNRSNEALTDENQLGSTSWMNFLGLGRLNQSLLYLILSCFFGAFALVLVGIWIVRSFHLFPKRIQYTLKRESIPLRKWDRRLRKFKIRRGDAETLTQFAQRLRNDHVQLADWIDDAAVEYEKYAELRYQ